MRGRRGFVRAPIEHRTGGTAWHPPPPRSMHPPVNVDEAPAALREKDALRRPLELYTHDLSEFTGEDVDGHGRFHYRYRY